MWFKQLQEFLHTARHPVIFCMGNELRNDDRIGIEIGQELKQILEIPIILVHNVPFNFIGKLQQLQCTHLVIIDGVQSGNKPGTISWFKPDMIKSTSTSTHMQEFDKLLQLMKIQMGYIPKIGIVGIEIMSKEMGDTMSEVVNNAKDEIILNMKLL